MQPPDVLVGVASAWGHTPATGAVDGLLAVHTACVGGVAVPCAPFADPDPHAVHNQMRRALDDDPMAFRDVLQTLAEDMYAEQPVAVELNAPVCTDDDDGEGELDLLPLERVLFEMVEVGARAPAPLPVELPELGLAAAAVAPATPQKRGRVEVEPVLPTATTDLPLEFASLAAVLRESPAAFPRLVDPLSLCLQRIEARDSTRAPLQLEIEDVVTVQQACLHALRSHENDSVLATSTLRAAHLLTSLLLQSQHPKAHMAEYVDALADLLRAHSVPQVARLVRLVARYVGCRDIDEPTLVRLAYAACRSINSGAEPVRLAYCAVLQQVFAKGDSYRRFVVDEVVAEMRRGTLAVRVGVHVGVGSYLLYRLATDDELRTLVALTVVAVLGPTRARIALLVHDLLLLPDSLPLVWSLVKQLVRVGGSPAMELSIVEAAEQTCVHVGKGAGAPLVPASSQHLVEAFLESDCTNVDECLPFLLHLVAAHAVLPRAPVRTRALRALAQLVASFPATALLAAGVLQPRDAAASVREASGELAAAICAADLLAAPQLARVVPVLVADPLVAVRRRCVRLARDVYAAGDVDTRTTVAQALLVARRDPDPAVAGLLAAVLAGVWSVRPRTAQLAAIEVMARIHTQPFDEYLELRTNPHVDQLAATALELVGDTRDSAFASAAVPTLLLVARFARVGVPLSQHHVRTLLVYLPEHPHVVLVALRGVVAGDTPLPDALLAEVELRVLEILSKCSVKETLEAVPALCRIAERRHNADSITRVFATCVEVLQGAPPAGRAARALAVVGSVCQHSSPTAKLLETAVALMLRYCGVADVRRLAVQAVVMAGTGSPPLFLRTDITRALDSAMATESASIFSALTKLVQGESAGVEKVAAGLSQHFLEAATAHLLAEDPAAFGFVATVAAAGWTNPRMVVPTLVGCLNSSNGQVQRRAELTLVPLVRRHEKLVGGCLVDGVRKAFRLGGNEQFWPTLTRVLAPTRPRTKTSFYTAVLAAAASDTAAGFAAFVATGLASVVLDASAGAAMAKAAHQQFLSAGGRVGPQLQAELGIDENTVDRARSRKVTEGVVLLVRASQRLLVMHEFAEWMCMEYGWEVGGPMSTKRERRGEELRLSKATAVEPASWKQCLLVFKRLVVVMGDMD